MPAPLTRLLLSYRGVASWAQLTERIPPYVVTRAAAAGRILRVLPRVYADPDMWTTSDTRLRAALLFAGEGSCLSHTTALAQWPQILQRPDPQVHVLTPRDRDRRSTDFVVVHRHGLRRIPSDEIVQRKGLPVTAAHIGVLDSWGVLPDRERRAPVINAVRIGLVDPAMLHNGLALRPRIRGRRELQTLIELLRLGCRSELELLGYTKILADPRVPPSQRQFSVRIGPRHYFLDIAWPELLLALELDGAAYHGSKEARERDVQRDSELARAGWLTIRITYDRLVRDSAGVVNELLEIIAVRREQLGRAS